MPKVTEEYIKNKKQMIVETAYKLCLQKTVSTVTMQDVINASGLSQGGIYRFYKDIDEIFKDMITELRRKANIKLQIDDIFSTAEEDGAKVIIHKIFELLGDYMTKELMGIVKINFELSVLTMNAPDRVEKILGDQKEVGNFEYIFLRTTQYFREEIAQGRMKMRVSEEQLLSYIASSYNGIEMSCIVNHCYRKLPLGEMYVPKTQLKTLETTVLYLLGLDEKIGEYINETDLYK